MGGPPSLKYKYNKTKYMSSIFYWMDIIEIRVEHDNEEKSAFLVLIKWKTNLLNSIGATHVIKCYLRKIFCF